MDSVNTNKLIQLNYLPDGLLDASPESLHAILPEPCLIHLSGRTSSTLFISVLLHGNEPTGLLAVQALLKKYQHQELPRSISLFFGNTEAASHGIRRLDQQPDFNRIWPGTPMEECAETKMAAEIVEVMKTKSLFASIDIHNNTGLNPHYACINSLEPEFIQLATLFGRFVVYFTRPQGVQSACFAKLCPAVTLECGRPDQQYGVEHALEFLDSCLHSVELAHHPVHHQDVDLFHTVAQVKIKDNIQFSFTKPELDLLLSKKLEQLNFNEVDAGTSIGTVNRLNELPLIALDEHGQDVSDQFFAIENNQLLISRATMPSMLTLNEKVIQQDCLCYLMERLTV